MCIRDRLCGPPQRRGGPRRSARAGLTKAGAASASASVTSVTCRSRSWEQVCRTLGAMAASGLRPDVA
eukprot:15381662-Alexandrium_andersonii.AAC.1